MKKLSVLITVGTFGCLAAFGAIDLKESKFTQVVNDVQIISTVDNSKHAASVDGLFKMPDVLRTGPGSRAELVAADNTITRVGANTIFSFDAANRSIHLEQGSLLFNSPKGKGGGSIHTAAATAAVLGTTIIVVSTPDGGFKVLTLEGTAEVQFLKGLKRRIQAGQLIFVLPGGLPGPILAFRLDQQVANSRLVMGFSKPLASLSKVNAQISQQAKQIASGKATDTGMLVGNSATSTTVQIINPIQLDNAVPNASAGPPGTLANPNGSGTSGGGGTTPGGGTPVPPPTGIPTAPPGTIIAQSDGSYLTPDGFVFTSTPATNGGTAGPTYAMGPAAATLTDTTISGPTLDPARIFTQAVTITIPANSFNGTAFEGFYARNITISSPTIDFSPYTAANPQNFVIFASENLTITHDLVLSAFATELPIFAGGTFSASPGITISGSAGQLEFGGRLDMNLNSVTFMNTGGGLGLESFGSINLNNVSLTASDSSGNGIGSVFINNGSQNATSSGNISLFNTTLTGDSVEMTSAGTLTLAGTSPSAGQISGANNVDLFGTTGLTVGVNVASEGTGSDGIFLSTSSGTLTVNNGAQLAAPTISMNSGADVLVDSIAPPSANSMNVTAVTTGTLQNTDLSNVGSLNVNAHTIVLNNVALPNSGTTFFIVANGALAPNPNTGASVVPGDLNFIRNVTYHGALANTPGNGFNVGSPGVP